MASPRRLCMLIPSRSRPAAVRELLEQLPDDPNVDFEICVDADDETMPDYMAVVGSAQDLGMPVRMVIYPPQLRRLAGILDKASVDVTSSGHYGYVGFMGDDHRPRTVGWATQLMAACEVDRGPGIAYGDDLVHHAALPTAVVMDSRIPRALRRMTFPGSQHLYLDDFWRDLGKQLSTLYYVSSVIIEHMHPLVGKAEWDDGWRYAQSEELMKKDGDAYRKFVADGGIWKDANTIFMHCRPR